VKEVPSPRSVGASTHAGVRGVVAAEHDYENDSDHFAYDVYQTGPVVAVRFLW